MVTRMSNYQHLLQLCVKVLSTFNPEVTGADTHLESFLQSAESSNVSSSLSPTSFCRCPLIFYQSPQSEDNYMFQMSANVRIVIPHYYLVSEGIVGMLWGVSVKCSN